MEKYKTKILGTCIECRSKGSQIFAVYKYIKFDHPPRHQFRLYCCCVLKSRNITFAVLDFVHDSENTRSHDSAIRTGDENKEKRSQRNKLFPFIVGQRCSDGESFFRAFLSLPDERNILRFQTRPFCVCVCVCAGGERSFARYSEYFLICSPFINSQMFSFLNVTFFPSE